jgi:predicted DNA-binding protein
MQTASALVAREKLFNMRMSAEEWERLDALAKHYGLNAAGVIRMLVKADADRLHKSEVQDVAARKSRPKR